MRYFIRTMPQKISDIVQLQNREKLGLQVSGTK